MAFLREYYPSDTLKLLNESEGAAGMSGEAAHSMARHLRHSPGNNVNGVGPRHTGVDATTFAGRFQANPMDDDGNYRINSGWLGKGDMALLLSNLLNSPAGQSGLHGLDQNAQRVVVQTYFPGATDFFGHTFDGAVAEIRTSPSAPTMTYHDNNPRNPHAGQLKSVKIGKPVHKGVIRVKEIAGAVAVLDNVGGKLHLQTFYPLFTITGGPKTEYDIGVVRKTVSFNASGQSHITLQAK